LSAETRSPERREKASEEITSDEGTDEQTQDKGQMILVAPEFVQPTTNLGTREDREGYLSITVRN